MSEGETSQFVVKTKLTAALKDIEGAEQELDHDVRKLDKGVCAARAQAMASIAQARAMVALVFEMQLLRETLESKQ